MQYTEEEEEERHRESRRDEADGRLDEGDSEHREERRAWLKEAAVTTLL